MGVMAPRCLLGPPLSWPLKPKYIYFLGLIKEKRRPRDGGTREIEWGTLRGPSLPPASALNYLV